MGLGVGRLPGLEVVVSERECASDTSGGEVLEQLDGRLAPPVPPLCGVPVIEQRGVERR
jgi:hypothetical protein